MLLYQKSWHWIISEEIQNHIAGLFVTNEDTETMKDGTEQRNHRADVNNLGNVDDLEIPKREQHIL